MQSPPDNGVLFSFATSKHTNGVDGGAGRWKVVDDRRAHQPHKQQTPMAPTRRIQKPVAGLHEHAQSVGTSNRKLHLQEYQEMKLSWQTCATNAMNDEDAGTQTASLFCARAMSCLHTSQHPPALAAHTANQGLKVKQIEVKQHRRRKQMYLHGRQVARMPGCRHKIRQVAQRR